MRVVVRLEGGIGNQLFQYVFARYISSINNAILELDIGIYSEDSPPSILQMFPGHNCIKTRGDLSNYPKLALSEKGIVDLEIFKEGDDVLKLNSGQGKSVYLVGYWQNYSRYFLNLKGDIRDEIYKNIPISEDFILAKEWILKKNNPVALHVRRGDYIDPSFGILPSLYYDEALYKLSNNIKSYQIIYFSDDHSWVESNLQSKYRGEIVANLFNLTDWEEIVLMSLCKHHIIANSTFSWWGCWLKSGDTGISMHPDPWFAKVGLIDDELICPDTWDSIELSDGHITKINYIKTLRRAKNLIKSYVVIIFIFFYIKL
jgi:hypothetical protein